VHQNGRAGQPKYGAKYQYVAPASTAITVNRSRKLITLKNKNKQTTAISPTINDMLMHFPFNPFSVLHKGLHR
jgi:hypothetical protein